MTDARAAAASDRTRDRVAGQTAWPGGASGRTLYRAAWAGAVAIAAFAWVPASAHAQTELCDEARRFMAEDIGMVAVVEPDTIDDWRTQRMVPGCRVTGAAATRRSDGAEARAFYEVVRDAGWMRTPDPRDAPNEASLRFRHEDADCLFNYYTPASPLDTDAEHAASDAVVLRPGERHFYILAMCTPAGPAAPRG